MAEIDGRKGAKTLGFLHCQDDMYVLDHHRNLIAYLPVMTLSVGPVTSLIPRLLLSIAVSIALLGIL
ncbi:MAG: hypothetical protein WBW79_17025, partial [Desulfocapsaceae bacterium]